ncbi:MAG: carboxypeptidase regulatory-like domain-containing protein [Planctomycetes bacterium]|nr:carboxypeptidase regulatory-like domain-containing protein [Planctomycetota bacterium]
MDDRAAHTTVATSCLLLIAALAVPCAAQGSDPIAKPITVRCVGHDDGLPRPGVPLYVGLPSPPASPDADGWVIAESPDVRRLRAATFVFTDPEGRATLGSSPQPFSLQVGEPYFRWGNPQVDGSEWTVEVGQHEPVGVRVVDAAGKPLADFPVALHAAGKDLSVAITDATGRAMLGVPPEFTARAVIAPAGWVGPKEGFPSIAESLAGRRGAVLTVPPHGTLRLMVSRNGQPVREPVHAVAFFAPESYAPLCEQPGAAAKDALGLVYPRVALGLELRGYSPLQYQGAGMLACTGPTEAGECKTVDLDLGPLITFRVQGVATAPHLMQPRVLLVTDSEELFVSPNQREDGTFVVDPRRALQGRRLLRIDLDVDAGRPGHRSGTLRADRALPAKAIELGEVVLSAAEPQLRGIVLDESGKPAAGVNVAITPTGERNRGYVIVSDAEGRFVSRHAIVRGDDGAPKQLFAYAYTDQLEAPVVQAVDGELTLTLRERAEGKKGVPQNGIVVARLRRVTDPEHLRMRVRLASARSGEFMPRSVEVLEGGAGAVVRFEGVRKGTFALRVPAADGAPVEVLDAIEVSGDGECDDARLADVDCALAMRQVVVEVVDAVGVPVAGARLEGPGTLRQTDGKGVARMWIGTTHEPSVLVSAPGWRSVRVEQWPAQQLVRLEPAGTLQVEVVGLPAEAPRELFEVWIRDAVRERFAGPRGKLAAGCDQVAIELPARGSYLPQLWLGKRDSPPDSHAGASVHYGTEPIEIGDAPTEPLRIVLTEEEIAQLKQMLAK